MFLPAFTRLSSAAMQQESLVWYRREDHAGLPRRLLACLVDAAILIAVLSAPGVIVTAMHQQTITAPAPNQRSAGRGTLAVFGLVVLLMIATPYNVFLRGTRGGTVGYRVAGVRLVDMSGGIPARATVLRRYLLSILIPIVFYVLLSAAFAARDQPMTTNAPPRPTAGQSVGGVIFLAIFMALLLGNYWMVIRDPRRQALHDKWSRTWVIRRSAVPAGVGRPIERAWVLGPLVLGYWDVEPLEQTQAATTAG
jgi:uncharacterized RDD family membrane protein YckC